MRPLPEAQWAEVARIHREELAGFILPRAVLEGVQGGAVFALDPQDLERVLVMNRFGFMQYVGAPLSGDAIPGILAHPAIAGRYLLWYDAPREAMDTLRHADLRGYRERTRTRHAPWAGDPDRLRALIDALPAGLACAPLTADRMAACDVFDLQLASRFWNSEADLLQHAGAQLVLDREHPVAICYAAGIAGGQAELDVMTLPDHRGRGTAKGACAAFILNMRKKGLDVVWDAFAANEASTRTAAALGFHEQRRYTFTTFAA